MWTGKVAGHWLKRDGMELKEEMGLAGTEGGAHGQTCDELTSVLLLDRQMRARKHQTQQNETIDTGQVINSRPD